MKKKQYYYLLIALLYLGCSSSQPQKNDNPKYIRDLSGYIEANKEKYNIGEDIEIKYVIQNNRGKLHQEAVTNGSKKISEAFQAYGFNAVSSKDQLIHLEVKDFGKPINGAISLKPKDKKVFVKNIFSGSKPGTYRLTFNLNWKENKQIFFKPIVVEIVDNQKPQENSTPESIDPQIRVSVRNLVDPETREEAEKEIVGYEAKGLIAVVEAMGDANIKLRPEAMFFLMRINDDYDINPIRALKWGALHENPEIRKRSIYVAGQIAPDEIIQIIKDRLVNDEDKNVRLTCINTLESLTDIIAVQLMVFALNDREVEIRKLVIEKLKERTSENFSFDPEASEEERKLASQKWREWAVSKYSGK